MVGGSAMNVNLGVGAGEGKTLRRERWGGKATEKRELSGLGGT